MSYGRWKQNWFDPVNPQKYIGNNRPFYRSSWELRVMNWFDLNKFVIAWSNERYVIPYRLPKELDGTGRIRRYFIDFYCEIKNNDGMIKKYLVEVKPLDQSIKPELPKSGKSTRSYQNKAIAYAVNYYKWEAAKQYCASKGFEWKVLHEQEVYSMNV